MFDEELFVHSFSSSVERSGVIMIVVCLLNIQQQLLLKPKDKERKKRRGRGMGVER